jgi:hypothetical protein
MGRYDDAKFLKQTRARVAHICDRCGKQIKNGEIYYSESIGKINAPGIRLKNFAKIVFTNTVINYYKIISSGAPTSLARKIAAAKAPVVERFAFTTGQEARAGPEGETSFPSGVNKNSFPMEKLSRFC